MSHCSHQCSCKLNSVAVPFFQSILYTKVLPKYGVKGVHFRCDGAGCFVGNEVKGSFGKWNKERTGSLFEMSYKNNVPGKGKTSLDGLFGILTQHLNRLIDEGYSFDSAETLYNLLKKIPLQHTEFHLLSLDRNSTEDWSVPKFIENYKLGRSFYFLKRSNNNEEVKAFCHSRHGDGKIISFAKPLGMCVIIVNFNYCLHPYLL